ncbi:DNA/RNA-binding protein KIN17-like isoform X1 [Monomorium pharaonis]|uniref:DNA/RNA-binding protein KIN17-like isoform X1 n=1 Tax=Monomorium pharaonis TaxID=307658 RepID=UPI0017461D87|nr:DNA/RNA-binding protein KIN17-like isoform X1 [Monomorium pharaonis]XP_036146458.1 DNA/RNA-binding protein KIN17-like isoform X1 [Monomorium pharaonis]XP_036146459.1 DNA/RNA-binding protein KIN17-like isoform X1 [Monomorium pharaonis]
MGKREKGTPKYMANKNKARGLQKLKYYCQMCKKQCRDFNGFKCHTTSESHHRQMLMFTENANQFIDRFSQEFLHGYVNLLKRQFGTRRVPANQVYQEYISDKGHIHMNATKWLTLTAFVKWLGSTGKCIVDETEKGLYITYTNRDPEALVAQEKEAKRKRMAKNDQKQNFNFIKQIKEKSTNKESETKKPFMRPEGSAPLILNLTFKSKPKLLVLNVNKLIANK